MNEESRNLANRYLNFLSARSKDTLKSYRASLNIFMNFFQEKSWETITIDDALFFYNNYRSHNGKPIQISTTIRRLTDVNRFYEWAIENKYLINNPLKLYVKTLRPQLKERQCLSKNQAKLLLSKIEDYHYYIFTLFLIKTGVRISEFINISLNDMDLSDRSIIIKSGKGNKDRYVFIDDELLLHIKQYLKYREFLNPKIDRLFLTKGGYKLSEGQISDYRRYLRTISKDILNIIVTPHVLRHTFGTLACESNMNIEILSKIMGHANVNTTMTYIHSSKEFRKKEFLRVMNNKDYL